MPKFIKLTSIDKDCSHLNVCIDSIETFFRAHPEFSTFEDTNEPEHTHVHFKGHSTWYNVIETTEEIEALIKERELMGELVRASKDLCQNLTFYL